MLIEYCNTKGKEESKSNQCHVRDLVGAKVDGDRLNIHLYRKEYPDITSKESSGCCCCKEVKDP
jgi:predicted nucleic acid-binding Zn finger protein